MTLGYTPRLYMLAFDHRASFSRDLLGIPGAPTAAEAERVADTKLVIYEAFEDAVAHGADTGAGLLVDEEYGAAVAHRAAAAGHTLAMPVERSGQTIFDFEYGDDFARHIEAFDPTFAKVLVRYNPEGDVTANRLQATRLRALSNWLHAHDRKLLLELLVPAEPHQLAAAGGQERYDAAVRPELVVETIRELHSAGVEPDIWKIEGFEHRADCEAAAEQARANGRDEVSCIVLGRGANEEKVRHWLEQGAGVPGYVGFAVGRTLWWDELVAYVAGDVDRVEAATRISANYRRLIEAYERSAAT